ncbi:MAG: hypothetical protein ABSF50_15120 [Burkholderiaceae bacterium]
MFAIPAARKDQPAATVEQDEWFETYTPPKDGSGARMAAETQERIRRRMIEEWMAQLPVAVRPWRLAAAFPQVMLQLIERWENRSAAAIVLDGFLMPAGHHQRWLAPEILSEVAELSKYVRAMRQNASSRASSVF